MDEHAQPPGEPPGTTAGAEPDTRLLLASQRTFLAWNRTALALIAGGIAVARFVTVGSDAAELTVALLLIFSGAFVAVHSHRVWRRVDDALRAGQPLPPSNLPQILTGGVVLIALAAVALRSSCSRCADHRTHSPTPPPFAERTAAHGDACFT
jgi:putative membrane protein